MSTVLQAYDRACAALAEVSSVTDVMALRDEISMIKLYARRVGDRELIERAMVLQLRSERRLGVLLIAAEEAGQLLSRGRKKKDTPEAATLDEVGIDRKLSMMARQAARMDEQAFADLEVSVREKIRSGRAVLVEMKDGPINGSRAVMSQRQEPDDSLDYFPTPPWATRSLVVHVLSQLIDDASEYTAWEPACGEGHMAEVLSEFFAQVRATDVFEHGYGETLDFLSNEARFLSDRDWIITNPPFGDAAEEFTLRALELAREGVAMFVRLQWLESLGRYENIFAKHPPTIVAFFAERVNLCKGHWDPEGGTATAYIWLVWDKRSKPQPPFWIPPGCRERLSKPDDVERFTARPVMKRAAVSEEGKAA